MRNHIKNGEKRERHIKNPNQRSATTPVHINGSHTRDIHPCGATHMFHHSHIYIYIYIYICGALIDKGI